MAHIVHSLGDVAAALDVDFSTAWRWKSSGMPVEPDGGYDVERVDQWRKLRVVEGRRRAPETMEMREPALSPPDDRRWTSEYRKAKALKEVMLLQELRGHLIEVDKVEGLLVARALALRKGMLSLGRRLAPVLVGRPAREIQAAIDDAAIKLLEEYSREDGLPDANAGRSDARRR